MTTPSRTSPFGDAHVAGIDRWRKGWVGARAMPGHPLALFDAPTIKEALEQVTGAHAVAIDMPMALPLEGRRAAEEQLKAHLGSAARSIFYSPVRAAIDCADRASADAVNRAAGGGGISAQSWGLSGPIRELRTAMHGHAQIGLWWETHPESSFIELNRSEPLASKKSARGAAQRVALLEPIFGNVLDTISASSVHAPLDDVLDALAATWSAYRIAQRTAVVYGPDGRDDEGFPLGIRI